jgi:hypothetical protein
VACQDLRADDSRDESTPWQAAVLAARDRLTGRTETSSVFFTARSTGTTIRSGKNGHGNECTDEAKIQEHQCPADQFGLVLQDTAQDHGDKSVEDSSGQNANDGAIGRCKVATSTGWIFLNDLDKARGEEANGDDGRDELDETQNALEPQVGSGVAKPLVCALDAHGER